VKYGETATARTGEEATARRRPGTQARSPEAPLVLERYRLLRRLGAGAFGSVWAARDERLERDVAVKILDRERVVGGRFEREARAAARLQHPAIVTLYEAGIDAQGAYLVCELVRGLTLARAIAEGRLSDRSILEIGIALCDALTHAHQAGVIHRDVKPSNVLIPARPAVHTPPAKLTDFGVAHVVGGDSLTRTGEVVGTDAYMAPEQARGLAAGPAADLYSVALVLYEALTGSEPPRRAGSMGAARPVQPAPLRRHRHDLPPELGVALDRALRARVDERGSVSELRAALCDCVPAASERRGVVAAPWRAPTLRRMRSLRRGHRPPDRAPAPAPLWDPLSEGQSNGPRAAEAGAPSGRRAAIAWPSRAPGAAAAAAAVAWLDARMLPGSGTPALLLAIAAAVTVLLVPRLAWLAVVACMCGFAAASGRAGVALLVAPAALAPALLLARRGELWPVPAGAVALGLIGLGGAWPALAGRARGLWARAVLGALGWCWLAFASALTGHSVYLRHPAGVPSPATFAGSGPRALHGAIAHLAAPAVLAGALVWALGAAVMPVLVRGRALGVQAPLALLWACGVSVGALALSGAQGGPGAGAGALGALAALALALGPSLYAHRRRTPRTEDTGARLA
jgi:tRNA A-37 threonylcarbamoyl transferase component Bud32